MTTLDHFLKNPSNKENELQINPLNNIHHSKRSVEDIYDKKTPREHVLLRPDTYIGSVNPETQKLYIFDEEKNKMIEREITFVAGLHKIFDEILVNAIDNKQRDKSMKLLTVDINIEEGKISVFNDGRGIPVEIHKKHKCYVPELIFGHMLTSSNFNDNEKRVVGGRNGYGAKLTNIYSLEFIVETCDGKYLFRQKHSQNMTKKSEPKIKLVKNKKNYTKITFRPDFKRFGMKGFDKDCLDLLKKRVMDVAGVSDKSVQVILNGNTIPIPNFKDFLSLYVLESMPILYLKVNERWEIGVSVSDGHFRHVSYVNSICTTQGGKHVDYVADMIAKYVSSKKKDLKIRQIKDFMFLFVNALIENPAFKSQTKDELTTKQRDFGSKCELPEHFLKKVLKSPIVTEAIEMAKHKDARSKARKTDGKKTAKIFGIMKLIDARHAGTKKSDKCTLILVEGDSAKTLAMAGLPALKGDYGQPFYGIYPLKGKVLNVREANHSQVANNPEITNIKKILGLRDGVNYENQKSFLELRYGRLMIMVDQDHDGSHIKGLLINLLHHFWPSLLKRRGFLVEFVTPIVVCKKRRGNDIKEFYTIPEYEKWREDTNGAQGYDIKYYKGLGTSSNAEAEKYFSRIDKHRIGFLYNGIDDDDSIKLAFSKSRVEDRKRWLAEFVPGTYLNQNVNHITYHDFIHKELILFSMADNIRSIPSIVDGLKPGQRKILYTLLRRNITKGVKVPQLAGYVMGDTAYHHGDAALQGTIVKMAQSFVASNNINLLFPNGQFGSRSQGGKDHANPRYISAHLSTVTRSIFHKDDDPILNYLFDDGVSIEPEFYVPILPMILVNGSEGIGTGWSTYIPCYNPIDLVKNIRHLLNNEEQEQLIPWHRNWTGKLRLIPQKGDFAMLGNFELIDCYRARITELPLKLWTEPYKAHLAKLMSEGVLSNIIEEHNINSVNFLIETNAEHPMREVSEHLLKVLKLTGRVSMQNLVLFDSNGKLKRFNSPEEILKTFFDIRLTFYQKRKDFLILKLEMDLKRIDNRVRFILDIIENRLKVNNRPKSEILQFLSDKKYDLIYKTNQKAFERVSDVNEENNEENNEEIINKTEKGFDYLLSMPIWSLTMERVQKLLNEAEETKKRLEKCKKTTLKEMWSLDLDIFEKELEIHEEKMDKEMAKPKRSKKTEKLKKRSKKMEKYLDLNNENDIKMDKKGKNKKSVGFFTQKSNSKSNSLFLKFFKGEKWTEKDLAENNTKKRKIIKTETIKPIKTIKNEPKITEFDNKTDENGLENIQKSLSQKFGSFRIKTAIKVLSSKNQKINLKNVKNLLETGSYTQKIDSKKEMNKRRRILLDESEDDDNNDNDNINNISNNNNNNNNNNNHSNKIDKKEAKTWPCWQCSYSNSVASNVCLMCHSDKNNPEDWVKDSEQLIEENDSNQSQNEKKKNENDIIKTIKKKDEKVKSVKRNGTKRVKKKVNYRNISDSSENESVETFDSDENFESENETFSEDSGFSDNDQDEYSESSFSDEKMSKIKKGKKKR